MGRHHHKIKIKKFDKMVHHMMHGKKIKHKKFFRHLPPELVQSFMDITSHHWHHHGHHDRHHERHHHGHHHMRRHESSHHRNRFDMTPRHREDQQHHCCNPTCSFNPENWETQQPEARNQQSPVQQVTCRMASMALMMEPHSSSSSSSSSDESDHNLGPE